MTLIERLEEQIIDLKTELRNTEYIFGLVLKHVLEKSECLVASEESALEQFGVYQILVSTEEYQEGTRVMVIKKTEYLSSFDWAKAMFGKLGFNTKENPLNNFYRCADRQGRIMSISHKHFIKQKNLTNDSKTSP